MSPALANFLLEAANFLVLAAALGWLLFRPIRRALEAEQAARAEAEQRVAARQAEASQLLQQAEAAHQKLEEELSRRRAELLAEAEREVAQLRQRAHAQQHAEREVLERKLAATREAEALALADTLGRLAGESVTELMRRLPGPDLDDALSAVACRELEALPERGRRGATLESARPLSAAASARLEALLPEIAQRRLSPELGAGVRITSAAGQVDSSAQSLARHLARSVTRATGHDGAAALPTAASAQPDTHAIPEATAEERPDDESSAPHAG